VWVSVITKHAIVYVGCIIHGGVLSNNTYTHGMCRCYLCDEQIETYVHYVQDTVY